MADVAYFDSLSEERAIFGVSICHSGPRQPRLAVPWRCRRVIQNVTNETETEKNNSHPYCFVGLWSYGPLNGGLAEFQSRIITRDHTMILPFAARQPHPNPNHAAHAAPCPLAAAVPNRGLNRPVTEQSSQVACDRFGARELTERMTLE
jgi:hypothetical protein